MLQDGMLLAVSPLDRETTDTYELFIKASDNGSPQREVRKGPTISRVQMFLQHVLMFVEIRKNYICGRKKLL